MSLYRAIRKGTLLKAIIRREPFHWIKTRPEVVEFGSKYGRWGIDATRVSSSSVVACFGLGEDITFETALINHFGCSVFGFDPTPRSVRYVTDHASDPRFRFFPYALADQCGNITFALPPESVADQVSASAVAKYASSPTTVEVPCLTLEKARNKFAIPRIDVLKMDIEGMEFAVIQQAIANHWLEDVSQVLVEFHHFLPGLTADQTRLAISLLQAAGFDIAWIGRTNHEYLFTRKLEVAA